MAQQLMELEVAQHVGVANMNMRLNALASATATAIEPGIMRVGSVEPTGAAW
jgi:hypothetical protein